jgi:phospholipid/cholesterol/gamma-HCH transport system substrate-binding protein
MNERVIQFRVGVVVVAATIITGIMIMLIGEGKTLFRQQYSVYLLFPQAPGVSVDTPVRKHGVLIGRVSSVELRAEGGVRLTARIDAGRQLRRSDVCVIKSASLLGDSVLEFMPTGEPAEFVQDNETIANGVVATNPVQMIADLQGTMETAVAAIGDAASEVQQLAARINTTLGSNDEQIRRIIDKSERAVDQFSSAMASIEAFTGDPELRDGLKKSLQNLPTVVADVQRTLGVFRNSMAGFDRITLQAEQNLRNLNKFTGPLGERGEQLAIDFAATLKNVNRITGQFVTFSEALNNREGTLGRILYDPELYDRLNEAVARVNSAARKIEPILNDVRIFTDKIAVDPRLLGVKGAVNGKPIGLGLKTSIRNGFR